MQPGSIRVQHGSIRVRLGSVRVRFGTIRVWRGSIRVRLGSIRERRGSISVRRGSNGSLSACCAAGPAWHPMEASLAEQRSDEDTRRQANDEG